MAILAQDAAPLKPLGLSGKLRVEQRIRALPIRWRIASIAALNTAVVLLLTVLIWDGARIVSEAWDELRQARQSDRLLVRVESETVRLQSLIHRYFNQPQPELLEEIERRRGALLATLRTQASVDLAAAGSVGELVELTEQFIRGFDQLRDVRTAVNRIYDDEVIKPAREMSGLFAIVESATHGRDSLVWPALGKSRESFTAILVSANAYYLSLASDAAQDAYKQIDTLEQIIPVMLDLADDDLQRNALRALGERTKALRAGLNRLAETFALQTRLLRDTIDGTQTIMVASVDRLTSQVRARERQAQDNFNAALSDVYLQVGIVSVAFLILIVSIGVAIASSISAPLGELKTAMHAIVSGDYDRRVRGIEAQDEIGEMARAVEIFRENALARRRAEDELRKSKEDAERALSELRNTQQSLIEAEKLAALGGLVAGVAHEVNNPVGISLTVASSLARRCDTFAKEIADGQLRRSRLVEFVEGNREAAEQLVSNLQRAGELIQSFKQVAVDRSHEQRRGFDLSHTTEQILASLRPGLRRAQVDLITEVPEAIFMDSYPGAYGQVLTNLVLNAVTHGFADGLRGTIRLDARGLGAGQVEISFSDDGAGMPDNVQRRAFEPFFTTRRNQGGTGLGLHIVYNIVTRRLGGRIVLASAPGRGTTFRITLPLVAPRDEAPAREVLAVAAR